MSNRERYKRAFQALHADNKDWLEAVNMDMNTERQHTRYSFSRRAVVAMMIAVLLVGSLTAAYAADLGGFRRMITLWVHGQATDAQVEFYTGEDGGADVEYTTDGEEEGTPAPASYVVTWKDENGEAHEMAGGGVALEPDGSERPLTMDEYLEHLSGAGAEGAPVGRRGGAAGDHRGRPRDALLVRPGRGHHGSVRGRRVPPHPDPWGRDDVLHRHGRG